MAGSPTAVNIIQQVAVSGSVIAFTLQVTATSFPCELIFQPISAPNTPIGPPISVTVDTPNPANYGVGPFTDFLDVPLVGPTFDFAIYSNAIEPYLNPNLEVTFTSELVAPEVLVVFFPCAYIDDNLPPATYLKPYTTNLVVTGPLENFQYISGLPLGLNFTVVPSSVDWAGQFTPASVMLSGIPQVYGEFELVASTTTYASIECDGNTFVLPLTVYSPPRITKETLYPSVIEKGKAYSEYITVSGGTFPFTFSIAAGSLPPGLFLDNGTGQILGTPTPARDGVYNFTIKVTDQNLLTDSKSYRLEVVTAAATSLVIYPSHISETVIVKDDFHQQYLYDYVPYSVKDIKDA